MASASRTHSAASIGLSPSASSPSSLIEKLSEDLLFQRGVLGSLLDRDDSDSAEEEIEAVKAEITNIKRQLAEARAKGNRQSHSISTPSSMGSAHGNGTSLGSGFPSRKRSIGSSHLGVGHSKGESSKSRRTSPSPGSATLQPGPEFFSDDDFQGFSIVDLTGDDDDEWRSAIRRQKEEEDRFRRRKTEADRDAAFARQVAGYTLTPTDGYNSAGSSQSSRNNAFGPTLSRSTPAWTSTQMDQSGVKPEPGMTLPARPGGFVGYNNERHSSGSSGINSDPEASRFSVPGAWEDSSSDGEGLTFGGVRQVIGSPSQPLLPSRPSLPSLPSALGGFGASDAFSYPPNVPAIELARQSSMAQRESPFRLASSVLPPAAPIGHRLQPPRNNPNAPYGAYPSYVGQGSSNFLSESPGRPGFIDNGNYFQGQDAPAALPSLAATINRVRGYDFNALVDENGDHLSDRLVSFLDDYVNDPRKTEEDIQQLLSNIRPDMEIPEEERGETPEAMKYPLYAHQQLALKWMTDMEEGSNKGGILADDMGLGKTISTLALMVSRPSSDDIKTNLIIGPVALIKQWEQEVKKKLKASHKMSVFLLHQKKRPYSELKNYSVVLTTYGSIASEWKQYNKHVEQRKESPQYNEEEDRELAKKCPLLHPRSKFYRVILDEAQCIKNKDTQSSRGAHKINAVYRWCLTGTPMMNNVAELYPLIRFLRIRPYCEFKTFQDSFKTLGPRSSSSSYSRDNAMRKLQAVLKAIMLRRMKSSMIDGKPILTLPEKTESSVYAVFSEDEQQYYRDVESRTQVLFNKYLRAGTVGKDYSSILVLLLRLRQACCHPHLMDFDYVGSTISDAQMVDLAKSMVATVVERIKAIEAFECPICYDAVEDPILLLPCGHDTCSECFASLTDNTAQNNIRSGNENGAAMCPVCRMPADPGKVINYTAFQKVHMPEKVNAEGGAAEAVEEVADSEDDSSLDDYTDSDDDSVGSLADFVVPDDEVEEAGSDEDARLDAELAAVARVKKEKEAKETKEAREARRAAKRAKKSRKAEGKAKAKSKAEKVEPHMLGKLRIEGRKNKEARRRYMHYLRDNWEDSAKVTKVIELLREIQETDEKTIIFSQWTALLDLIECQIKYNLRFRYCRYTGDMSRNQRDEAVQDFTENPRNKIMLVSLKAGNAGLNLTVASRVIICDPFWNPYIEMQAVDRAHRIGQQREVKVHRILVQETVEDRILNLQEEKRNLVEAALDEGSSKNLGRLSERELAYLFGVNPARR
ncbi:ATP-dependent helicase ULS1 [Madurella mycetomatis]|uniref:ATP-dependent helicase ULS1 n=1 Tax=Madurella mycetomatis TaxID=100816 RepID=A0A175VTN7_9PEZI|nr:ATP-dependent helicase ULS1 [Madurella mycetomatis]